MGFELSNKTARRLKQFLQKGEATKQGRTDTAGTGKFDTYVKITGPISGDYYPCVCCEFNTSTESWTDFSQTNNCVPANDTDELTADRRYRVLCSGLLDDGTMLFVADPAQLPALGCYLKYDEGELTLNPDTLVGYGLEVADDESSGTCDPIRVKEGCHVLVDADGVHVTPDTLAGQGLEVQDDSGGECDKLKVKTGCGVRIQEDGAVGLDLEAICTEAIQGVNDDGSGCSISLRYGCHLDLGPDLLDPEVEAIHVTPSTLAGQGLEVQDNSGCDSLKVKTGCGVRLDGNNAVGLDLEAICTEAIQGVNDDGAGCSISLRYGCHLDLGPDLLDPGVEAIHVTPSTLAGDGLEVQDVSGTCDPIRVKEGCHVLVDAEGVHVTPDTLAGTGLDVEDVSGCGRLKIDTTEEDGPVFSCITAISQWGCGITYTVTPVTFRVNPAGVFLGFEAGEGVDHDVALDCEDDPLMAQCVDALGSTVVMGCEATSGTTLGSTVVMGCAATAPLKLGSTVVMGCGITEFEQITIYTWTCEEGVCTSQIGVGGTYTTYGDCITSGCED